MPLRLRPTGPIAADALLVGDPGRAMLLAQDLLEKPKMSNHARGLWGYGGRTESGHELTVQSTGMGGPSAALVLADLRELGVGRAIRIGSCAAAGPGPRPGSLALVERALAAGGSATAFGVEVGDAVLPDEALTWALREGLDPGDVAVCAASFDLAPAPPPTGAGFDVADMQTVAILARAEALELDAAALLIVVDGEGGALSQEEEDVAARRAGRIAAEALSNPKVEG